MARTNLNRDDSEDTFRSFSEEYASSDNYTNGSDESQGYTFSDDAGIDNLTCLPEMTLGKFNEKPAGDATSPASTKSNMTMYGLLSVIDSAVDAVVDVVIPIERSISKIPIGLALQSPPSTSTVSPNSKQGSKMPTASPKSARSLKSSKAETLPLREPDEEEARDDSSLFSFLTPKSARSLKSRNEDARDDSSVSSFSKLSPKSHKISRRGSPKSQKSNRDRKGSKAQTVSSPEPDVEDDRDDSSVFAYTVFSPKSGKTHEVETKMAKESTEESPGVFAFVYDWFSPTNEVEEVVEATEEETITKKKGFRLGRPRSKKNRSKSDVSEMSTPAVEERYVAEGSRFNFEEEKPKRRVRSFSPRKFKKAEVEVEEAEVEVETKKDDEWWGATFLAATGFNGEENELLNNTQQEENKEESKEKTKRKGFRRMFSGKSAQDKSAEIQKTSEKKEKRMQKKKDKQMHRDYQGIMY